MTAEEVAVLVGVTLAVGVSLREGVGLDEGVAVGEMRVSSTRVTRLAS